MATVASAHPGGEELPWNVDDRWVLAGLDEEKGEMTFVALGRVSRAGNAAKVETLRVHRDVDERFGTDQAHYHMLVDCQTRDWTRLSFRGYRPDGSAGRLLTRDIGPRSAPQGGSLRRAFDLACTAENGEETTIAAPYAFARQQLSAE